MTHHANPLLVSTLLLMFAMQSTTVAQPKPNVDENPIVWIRLRGQSRVDHSLIVIGDVAQITGGRVALRRQVSQLDLERLADTPEEVRIRRSRIELRLRLAGVSDGAVRVVGPDEIVVSHQPQALDDARVVAALRGPLAETWGLPEESVRVRLEKPLTRALPADLQLPVDFELKPFIAPDVLPGRQRMTMGIYQDGQLAETFTVPVSSQVARPVAITRRPLRTGELVTIDNVYFKRQVMVGRDAIASVANEALKQYAVRPVGAGRTLTNADLTASAPKPGRTSSNQEGIRVDRRTPVTLVARRGRMRVVVRNAQLLSSAKVGDYVRVRNIESNQTVSGQLVSPSVVEVSF